MDVTTFAPPTGSAQPGNLYADLQTRTLWLGVDPAVDNNGAVLISDIVALQSQIAAGDADSKQYTLNALDGLLPAPRNIAYSKINHTHTSSQITDFTSSVVSVIAAQPTLNWVRGMITLYSGLLSDIGVGGLAGWALCDGSNGTPDLRDRFIIGAGNKLPGAKNPLTSVLTDVQGAHTPVISPTVLTWSHMPAHAHSFSDTATTNTIGAHAHSYSRDYVSGSGGDVATGGTLKRNQDTLATADAGAHAHTVTVSGNTSIAGADVGHSHSASAVSGHQHTLTSTQVRDVLPFYALAYIMKL